MRHGHASADRVLQLIFDGSDWTQLYFLWLILRLYAAAPLLAGCALRNVHLKWIPLAAAMRADFIA